ncbi:hypothetical protein CBS101457_003606 [Exobasidium rhododendri]|nr:hypothetical protein CBS101457_003606 [Exobasidium rhododendri]
MTTAHGAKPIWLDCDPGHDDAIALLFALFAPDQPASFALSTRPAFALLGVSTVHGNAPGSSTYLNAVRLLSAFKIDPSQCRVWRGADEPLMRKARFDAGIHGEGGLSGVECLPHLSEELVQKHLLSSKRHGDDGLDPRSSDISSSTPLLLISHQLNMLQSRLNSGLPPITLIATGPLTNIALLIKMCPGPDLELLRKTVKEIVLMGGSAGVPGNRTPLAEWNILVDPEAASIVFDSPLPVVMAGLNVTHQAIFTTQLHRRLLLADQSMSNESLDDLHSKASPLRRLVSSAMTFFTSTYASEFGFTKGPPVHDLVAVAYVLDPTLFCIDSRTQEEKSKKEAQRYAVKIDTSFGICAGTTVVDFYNQWEGVGDTWTAGGRNAVVLETIDTERFWDFFFQAVDRAEIHTVRSLR